MKGQREPLAPRRTPRYLQDDPPQPPIWDSPIVRRGLTVLFLAVVAYVVIWLGVDPDTIPWPPAP